jgi:hypothetical protein
VHCAASRLDRGAVPANPHQGRVLDAVDLLRHLHRVGVGQQGGRRGSRPIEQVQQGGFSDPQRTRGHHQRHVITGRGQRGKLAQAADGNRRPSPGSGQRLDQILGGL